MTELDHDYMPRTPRGILCRAAMQTGNQAVSGVTQIPLDTVQVNDDSTFYEFVNHSITVLRRGLYVVTGCISITAGTASSYSSCFIQVNGTTIKEEASPLSAANTARLSVFAMARLSANDVISLYGYGDNPYTATGASTHDTYLDATYVGS